MRSKLLAATLGLTLSATSFAESWWDKLSQILPAPKARHQVVEVTPSTTAPFTIDAKIDDCNWYSYNLQFSKPNPPPKGAVKRSFNSRQVLFFYSVPREQITRAEFNYVLPSGALFPVPYEGNIDAIVDKLLMKGEEEIFEKTSSWFTKLFFEKSTSTLIKETEDDKRSLMKERVRTLESKFRGGYGFYCLPDGREFTSITALVCAKQPVTEVAVWLDEVVNGVREDTLYLHKPQNELLSPKENVITLTKDSQYQSETIIKAEYVDFHPSGIVVYSDKQGVYVWNKGVVKKVFDINPPGNPSYVRFVTDTKLVLKREFPRGEWDNPNAEWVLDVESGLYSKKSPQLPVSLEFMLGEQGDYDYTFDGSIGVIGAKKVCIFKNGQTSFVPIPAIHSLQRNNSYSPAGSPSNVMRVHPGKSIQIADSGTRIAYISENPRSHFTEAIRDSLYVVEIPSGKSQKVLNDSYESTFTFSPHGRFLLANIQCVSNHQSDFKFMLYDLDSNISIDLNAKDTVRKIAVTDDGRALRHLFNDDVVLYTPRGSTTQCQEFPLPVHPASTSTVWEGIESILGKKERTENAVVLRTGVYGKDADEEFRQEEMSEPFSLRTTFLDGKYQYISMLTKPNPSNNVPSQSFNQRVRFCAIDSGDAESSHFYSHSNTGQKVPVNIPGKEKQYFDVLWNKLLLPGMEKTLFASTSSPFTQFLFGMSTADFIRLNEEEELKRYEAAVGSVVSEIGSRNTVLYFPPDPREFDTVTAEFTSEKPAKKFVWWQSERVKSRIETQVNIHGMRGGEKKSFDAKDIEVIVLENNDADYLTPPFEDSLLILSEKGVILEEKSQFNTRQFLTGSKTLTALSDGSIWIYEMGSGNIYRRLNNSLAFSIETYFPFWEGIDKIYSRHKTKESSSNFSMMNKKDKSLIYGPTFSGIDVIYDPLHNSIWTASQRVQRYDGSTFEVKANCEKIGWRAVSIDYTLDGSVWIAEVSHPSDSINLNRLLKLSMSGDIISSIPLPFSPMAVAVDRKNSVLWTGGETGIAAFTFEGKELFKSTELVYSLCINRVDSSVWVGESKRVMHYSSTFQKLHQMERSVECQRWISMGPKYQSMNQSSVNQESASVDPSPKRIYYNFNVRNIIHSIDAMCKSGNLDDLVVFGSGACQSELLEKATIFKNLQTCDDLIYRIIFQSPDELWMYVEVKKDAKVHTLLKFSYDHGRWMYSCDTQEAHRSIKSDTVLATLDSYNFTDWKECMRLRFDALKKKDKLLYFSRNADGSREGEARVNAEVLSDKYWADGDGKFDVIDGKIMDIVRTTENEMDVKYHLDYSTGESREGCYELEKRGNEWFIKF